MSADDPAGVAPLRDLLTRVGALPPARAVAVVTQVAAALDAVGTSRAARRDVVNPANIVIDADEAYLTDLDADAGAEALAYLAPERLTRNAAVDAATDVYALACVLYECLTGSPPFPATDDVPALIAAHASAPVPRPSQQLSAVPAGFDDVIARGLAKDPDERYASAGELAVAAQQVLDAAEQADEPDEPEAADESEAADQAADEPETAEAPEPADDQPGKPKRRRKRRRLKRPARKSDRTAGPKAAGVSWRRWVAVGVLAVVLAGAGYEGWLLFDQHRTEVAAAEALDAAKKFTLALTSVDPNAVDKGLNEVKDNSTGEFKEHFTAASEQLRQALIDNRAEAHGTVIDAAVISASTDEVEVMLFVDQSVSNANAPEPALDRSRVTMTMVKVDGRWLTSKVDLP